MRLLYDVLRHDVKGEHCIALWGNHLFSNIILICKSHL